MIHRGSQRLAYIGIVTFFLCSGMALHAQPKEGLDGLWRSDGYGLLLYFSGDHLTASEVTSISCIASWKAERKEPGVYSGDHGVISFLGDKSPRVIRMHLEGTVSNILFRRITSPPKACSKELANTPANNYAVLWQTYRENYPFFTLHKTDWQDVDRKYRPQAAAATDPTALFNVFVDMIEPLHDAHTGVEAGSLSKEFDGWRTASNELTNEQWDKAQTLIDTRYIEGSLVGFCNKRLEFGMLHGSIAYLRVTAFYGFVKDGTFSDSLGVLNAALDQVFSHATSWKGLVIDVRQNHGGDDALGIALAARLTKSRYLAYKKAALESDGKQQHFTSPQAVEVNPTSRPSFRGSVILLTGPDTVSAGETLAMALMGREPHVMRIGLDTQGVFSDVLTRSLLNGWRFRLPNEVYYTANGKSLDGSGVPSDIAVSFFSTEDIQAGRDTALEKTIQVIAQRGKQ
jgi:hypothetical protein